MALIDEMKEWRHHLHSNPEPALEEYETAKFISSKLKEFGFEVFEGVGKTGVVGRLTLGDGKRIIGLRADMDCITLKEENDIPYKSTKPGFMHGCGHDGHTTTLLGACKLIAERKNFNGTVIAVFQPAEEPGYGSKAMIEDGFFEKFPIEEFYGMHNMPALPEGTVNTCVGGVCSSEDDFIITIKGRGGHASSPQTLVDPIPIAAQIILAIQTIVSRNASPMNAVVISFTEINTDGGHNAIPSTVWIKGDARTYTSEDMKLVETRMRSIVENICKANGAEGELIYTHEFSPTVNTKECADALIGAATKVVGKDKVNGNATPMTFSEDFGRFLDRVPGCYFLLGSKKENSDIVMLHNCRFNYKDEILETGAKIFCQLVEDRLK